MTQKTTLDSETVRWLIDRQLEERLKVVPRNGEKFNCDAMCEVVLPLHWSDGDVASVFIGERNGGIIVHDAGQIQSALSWAVERGLAYNERQRVEQEISELEIQFDPVTKIAFVEARQDNLLYWLMEMGRIMTMVPHLYAMPDGEGQSQDCSQF